ncbi:MAG: peptidoglycan DD-metalloendopeptidase family protein [Nitrospira sp. SB0662_bin_26]|nr:peptidoglycan DD-metalloendopeptidase family protein [Nitrospira sp. SB0662_bin_26]
MGNPQSTIHNPQSAIWVEKRRLVLACCVVLSLVTPLWSWGASLQEKIEKEKQTLQQLKQEIRKTRKERDQSRKKQAEVLQSIERLDRQLHKERRESTSINREIKQIDRELDKIDAQLTGLRSDMRDKQAVIGIRLKRLYMEGRAGWVSPLVAATSYPQFQRRLLYLSSLAKWERNLFEEYRRQVAQSERLHAKQEKIRESLVARKSRIAKKLSVIRDVKSQKRVVLSSLKKTTRSHELMLRTLDQAESRKETLLKKLEQRSQIASGTIKKHTTDVFRRGALLWPADGDLVGVFGRQKHPTFDTYVRKKGIEIASKEGSAIRAVSGGDVVYADWLRGYGLVVIMDHGNNYFTFYAHASKLLVKEGEMVAKGAVLGETGSSGLTNRSILYFELRKGTKPVNPLRWLARR